MGFSIRGFSVAMMLVLLSGMEAQAQRPPKYVRTPYVEVYRDPFGGKHIRTPFAEIHKPGRVPPGFVGPPIYAFPEGPREYAMPPDVRARWKLYSAAAELSRSLEQFATATTWQRYFALTPGGTLAPDQRVGESAKPTPDFATLLGRFESVEQNPQFSMIAALPAFGRTHELLLAYVSEYMANPNPSAEELPTPLPDEVRRGNVRR
jgi:hypothetical protein